MKIVNITQTKNNLSALIDIVKQGETIIIMDRNRPVARLESALNDKNLDPGGRIARLERKGVIRRPSSRASNKLLDKKPPKCSNKSSILQALIAERENDR